MLLKAENLYKSIGLKDLFEDLNFVFNEGEKIALIGRNGLGKTTLLKILSGEDTEFHGKFETQKNLTVVLTRQEHFLEKETDALDYVLADVPRFFELEKIIKEFEKFGEEKVSLEKYCDVINEFSDLGYFEIKNKIVQSLIDFGLTEEKILSSLTQLSGGEKRFVELVRVMYSTADLALIDEPTNHMDYVGKEKFIKWLKNTKQSIFVVTHDRDVLKHVDKIFELKDRKIFSFVGNYDDYIKQNNLQTVSAIHEYESGTQKLEKLHKQMIAAKVHKLQAKSTKSRIAARIKEEQFKRQYEKLKEELERPSFWIDQESLEEISDKVVDKYHKYKEKNINILQGDSKGHKKLLIRGKDISLGYSEPLFKDINFELYHGDRLFIKGRNGAGKTTLVKTIISLANQDLAKANVFAGEFKFGNDLKIGIYEQEVHPIYLKMTLREAIIKVYQDNDLPISNEKINKILRSYLFDPETDMNLTFDKLSGGQKARFQLIKMFSNNPNLLILDEPTNHLDLPSIEELENALLAYHGGIIFISHDSYFIEKIEGKTIEIIK